MIPQYAFISYSTKDQEYADKVYDFLTKNGINAWLATKDIHGGESFANEITGAIKGCKAFIFILSQNSDNSPHCGNELSIAFNERKKIIPFRLHEFNISESNTYFLQQAQWIDSFKDEGASYNELLEKVSNALNEKEIIKTTIKIKTTEEKQIENFVKRAYQALSEKDFDTANDFAENILNINMEYAEAYLIKTLCDLKLKNVEQLKKYKSDLYGQKNFEYAKQYAKKEYLKELEEIETEHAQFVTYNTIKEQITKPFDYDLIKGMLETNLLRGYKDCDKLLKNLPDIYDERIVEFVFSSVSTSFFVFVIVSDENNKTDTEKKEAYQNVEKVRSEIKQNIKDENNEIRNAISTIKNENLKNEMLNDYEHLYSISLLFQDRKYGECLKEFSKENLFKKLDNESRKHLINLCEHSKKKYQKYLDDERKDLEKRHAREMQNAKEEKRNKILYGFIIGILVFIFCGPMSFLINLIGCANESCSNTETIQETKIDTTEIINTDLEDIVITVK